MPDIYKEHIGSGECVVRALISAGEPFDPAVLIELFENSELNQTLKCTIGYVLSISKTYNIEQWLKEKLKLFLYQIFDKYSYYEKFQKLVQRYSTADDIPFIKQKAVHADTKRKSRELFKITEKIRTRKRIPAFP